MFKQHFVIEKEMGQNGKWRAVAGPFSTSAEANQWRVLRVIYTETIKASRPIQVMGKSQLMRQTYNQDYGALLHDVGYFTLDWRQMLRNINAFELNATQRDMLRERYGEDD